MKSQFALGRAAVAGWLGLVVSAAQAVPVAFTCTSNDSGVCPAVADQIVLDMVDLGAGQATFTFSNSGPLDSSLTDIYWRSSSLVGGGAIVDSGAGVSFSWGASPANPGGGITWDAALSADSNAPTQPNGVNPGEWVSFTLGYSGSFDALLTEAGQVAIHLQHLGVGNEDSDWAVSTAIPEPHIYALMFAGLGVIGFVARRRRVI